ILTTMAAEYTTVITIMPNTAYSPWLPISEVSELVTPAIGTRRSLLASGVADETQPARDDHRFEPGMGPESFQYVSDVIAHRLRRQMQLCRDLLGRSALRQEV